ncbi:peptidoglycan-binding protein [Streptomyces sp. NPDC006544]|uniref:peptidoglycan-binding protein n=1 Tax=Streptomyces sp. NPDC006544 TaxID=3154583 RepID=UPI0033A1D407
MSPDLDESGTVPDDRLLVRPYVAPSVQPEGPTALAWPQTGPVSVAAQLTIPSTGSEPPTATATSTPSPSPLQPPRTAPPFAPASVAPTGSPSLPRSGAGRRAEGGSRLPFVALALLALTAAGVLAWLLHEPDGEPPRAVAPPGLSVPVLPARSPGAGEEPTPGADPAEPTRPTGAASARATTAPTPSGTPADASRDATTSAPSGGARPSSDGAGTLRPGDRGPEVRALQERLFGQGFTYVAVTGVYDEQTRRGVTQLQQNRGIKGDPPGVYGPATRAAFGSGY